MLILGSKSPRRKEILEMVNIPFKIVCSNAEENIIEKDPKEFVIKTSKKKALAIIDEYPLDTILCCDTIVYIDNDILGKPKDKNDAFNMIKKIQGREHYVLTGVFLGNKNDYESFSVCTKVYVQALTDEEILEYVNTTEPYDKAGSYAIQGIFGKYIEKIDGDYYNVMGLPLNEVHKRLLRFITNK